MNLGTPATLRRDDLTASISWVQHQDGSWSASLDRNYGLRLAGDRCHLLRKGVVVSDVPSTAHHLVRELLRSSVDDRVPGELDGYLRGAAPNHMRAYSFTFTKYGDIYGSADFKRLVPAWCVVEIKQFVMKTGVFVAVLPEEAGPRLFVPVAPNLHLEVTLANNDAKYDAYRVVYDRKLSSEYAAAQPDSPQTLADLLDECAEVRAYCMEDGVFVRKAPPNLRFTRAPRATPQVA